MHNVLTLVHHVLTLATEASKTAELTAEAVPYSGGPHLRWGPSLTDHKKGPSLVALRRGPHLGRLAWKRPSLAVGALTYGQQEGALTYDRGPHLRPTGRGPHLR